MHGVPRLPRPQLGRLYLNSRIDRWLRSMFLPSDLLTVQVCPRSREMNSWRPPTSTVEGLCGDKRIGVFQLNCTIASGSGGVLITLPRPPPRPPPPPPPPAAPPPAAPAPPPAAPPPPPPPAPAACGTFGFTLCV